MSFILRNVRGGAVTRGLGGYGGVGGAKRGFAGTASRGLKESDRDNPSRDPEKHKQDQLAKQKEGKGHWKPELASDSEEAITADRSHQNESIEDLQEKTKEYADKKHK
ncbi:hypothetical protein HYALB_00000004 [Hymenoscyphus albidus]|uniref:Uncharacterized protein n=1 Tax=Hymenoscyphus albidus TaxID=595503 RepID=A0A9N9PYW7_9HELO|nr:hypothetical protein HYALB_00000004 [Hymenoscyphus albidus]